MEQGRRELEASEASIEANPGGEFMYGTWFQLDHLNHESGAVVRRVWLIDGYISPDNAWTLPGTSGGSGADGGSSPFSEPVHPLSTPQAPE